MKLLLKGTPLWLAGAVVLAGCGGERGELGELSDELEALQEAAAEMEAEFDAYVESAERPADTEAGAKDCALADFYMSSGSAGMEIRLPRGGTAVMGWQLAAYEYDRETLMDMTSDQGALELRTLEAPIGTIRWSVSDQTVPQFDAKTYLVKFNFEHQGKWYMGQIPIRSSDAELVEKCLARVPDALATLRPEAGNDG